MLESIALIDILLFLVDDRWVSRKNDRLDEVSGVVDLSNYLLVLDPCIPLLDPVLSLHLDHFTALAYQVKASSHHLRLLSLEGQEALELDEAHILDRTLHWHVDHSCPLRQDR